ncbi:MAG: hypothetical protein JNK72_08815 [Myxococcales bacterium]|nr:hypothetical protein [Myxococcales bacterium]
MTSIKGPTPGIAPAAPQEVTAPKASGVVAVGSTRRAEVDAAGLDPSARVIAELKAGAISPDLAVERLTAAALEKARLPATMQPRVRAQVQHFLATDPSMAALLGRMGARAPSDE